MFCQRIEELRSRRMDSIQPELLDENSAWKARLIYAEEGRRQEIEICIRLHIMQRMV